MPLKGYILGLQNLDLLMPLSSMHSWLLHLSLHEMPETSVSKAQHAILTAAGDAHKRWTAQNLSRGA